jgi:hypothetical protein
MHCDTWVGTCIADFIGVSNCNHEMHTMNQSAFPFPANSYRQRLHTPTPPGVEPDPSPDIPDPVPGPDAPPVPEREPDETPPGEVPPAGDPPDRTPPMRA